MNKRMKKKKISSKRKVRILERVRKSLCDSLEFQKEQIRRQHDIIRALGSKDGYEFLDNTGSAAVETETKVKSQRYGDYVVLTDEMKNEIIDSCEEELCRGIVKGLMENNYVQFIVKNKNEENGPFGFNTVAAKINVIPWHEMVKK